MPDKLAMLEAVSAYLREHPEEILRAARNLTAFKLGIPLDALRWLAGQARGKRAPRDVEIDAVPPGLRLGASLELMNTPLRATAVVYVDRVKLAHEELRLELRLSNVALQVLDDKADSPVAALIKSGALDLSRPGNLAAFMPKRPAVLVEAAGDRNVIDLMKHPKLATNGKVGRALKLIETVLAVRAVETQDDHLDVSLRAFPDGLSEAVAAIRSAL